MINLEVEDDYKYLSGLGIGIKIPEQSSLFPPCFHNPIYAVLCSSRTGPVQISLYPGSRILYPGSIIFCPASIL